MNFIKNKSYYISTHDAVIRKSSNPKSDPLNHLLFGDWLKYLGEENADFIKARSRGCNGWLPKSSITDKRVLEINFVDIGQGDSCHIVTPDDEIILIDSGKTKNLFRFINWRYNLRSRKVAGVDEETTGIPMDIEYVVVSHPDEDHYYGFKSIFESKKVKVLNVFHNGIVERPIKPADKLPEFKYYSKDDLGAYVKGTNNKHYLWDVVNSNTEMHGIISKHKTTRKKLLSTYREGVKNNPDIKFKSIDTDDGYFDKFDESSDLKFKVLGPLKETVEHDGNSRKCLKRLGSEGITKNGHSVVFQAQIGKLKVMLGGDLNTESEDYLLQHYCETDAISSKLEQKVYDLKGKLAKLTPDEKQDLSEAESTLNDIVTKGRRHFQVDVAKACHHGSHHFSETFLKSVNPLATVISSGDNENYSHPRPDALGAFGKYGRGMRPLIFSTEIARSTKEFTEVKKYFDILEGYKKKIAEASTSKKRKAIEKEMDERKDRNVAVYGMITLRTDGEQVIMAQKLEVKGGDDKKWDIHPLLWNENRQEFEYHKKGGH